MFHLSETHHSVLGDQDVLRLYIPENNIFAFVMTSYSSSLVFLLLISVHDHGALCFCF